MRPIPNRYNTDGPWLKGNTHIHTTCSDGGKDYPTVASLYAERGYDFIFITDHNHVADIESLEGLPLLAINGVEIDGSDRTGAFFHAVGLGVEGELLQDAAFEERVANLHECGALVVLAHPYWSGNSIEDALRHDFDGVEIYNHICNYLNGKSFGAYHFDAMLERNPRALCFSADDAHLNGNEPFDGGWIMVSAPECTKQAILAAIRAGNFYATRGPSFFSIHADAETIRVRTSPVRMIRLVNGKTGYAGWGQRAYAGPDQTVTEAEFEVTEERRYLRVEIEDEWGRLAWTNAVLEPDE